jgi:hypothetical protein
VKLTPLNYVTVVDLDADVNDIGNDFSEFQRRQLPDASGGLVDATRVVVFGRYSGLCACESLVEDLVLSASVERILFVVTGSEEDPGPGGCVLELPVPLGRKTAAVLWIGDPRGVLWRMRTAKAQALTVSRDDPEGEAAHAALIEISTIVSPGLHVVVPGGGGAELLSTADASAIHTLAGETALDLQELVGTVPPAIEGKTFLFGNAPPPPEIFEAEGPIGRLVREIHECHAGATKAASEIIERPSVRARADEPTKRIRILGQVFSSLKTLLRDDLFEHVDGSDGLDPSEIQVLKKAGLRAAAIQPRTETNSGEAENELRDFTVSELRKTGSLLAVVGELRVMADRARPRSSRETIAALDNACPDSLIDHLKSFPSLRIRLGGAHPLTTLFALFAVTLCIPPAFIPLPIAGVVLLALAMLLLSGTTTLRNLKGFFALERDKLYVVGGTAAAGMIVGGIVRATAESNALTIGASIAVPLLYALWAREVWHDSTVRWVEGARLEEVLPALDQMLDTTVGVTMNDWILANPRVQFARTATRIADALEQIRAGLLGEIAPSSDVQTRSAELVRRRCNPAVRADLDEHVGGGLLSHANEIEEIVMHDYIDLIESSIAEHWVSINSAPNDQSPKTVYEAFQERSLEYRNELQLHGLFREATVGFATNGNRSVRGARKRADLLADLWREIDGLDDLLAVTPDSDIVQFCAPDDLLLLNESPESAKMVRFAPASYSRDGSGLQVTRTEMMLIAGVLRLVPLRAGTARITPERKPKRKRRSADATASS